MKIQRSIIVAVFGVAFGFVEAAVVVYLRAAHGGFEIPGYQTILGLGIINFVILRGNVLGPTLTRTEMWREAATLVMLLSLAYLVGYSWRQRLGAFLIAFACWDLSYYLFLKLLIGWPANLKTLDIFFLLPVAWVGPVVTPIVTSIVLLAVGFHLVRSDNGR